MGDFISVQLVFGQKSCFLKPKQLSRQKVNIHLTWTYETKRKNSIFFLFAEVDLDESNNVSLEEQVDLLDDYTPLDPAYLPAGLGEDDNKVRIFLTTICRKEQDSEHGRALFSL